MEWIGSFNAYDDERHPQRIRIGIEQEGEHTVGIYLDEDMEQAEAYVCERETAIDYIKQQWGNCKTFKWISGWELTHINITGIRL